MNENDFYAYPFAFELFLDVWILEIRPEVNTDSCILIDRYGWIVGTMVDIYEGFTLRFTIFEVNDFASRHCFQSA